MDEYLSKPLSFIRDPAAPTLVENFPIENNVDPMSPTKINRLSPTVAAGLLRERLRLAAIRDLNANGNAGLLCGCVRYELLTCRYKSFF